MTDVEPCDDEPLCPQYWAIFSVGGSTGTYEVSYDRGLRLWRCTCRASMFDHATPCKHIRRVRAHGCFGVGPNDLARVGVSICGMVPRMARRAGGRCCCGQPLFAPVLAMADDAGRQIVRVRFQAGGGEYGYVWGGAKPLSVGDVVSIVIADRQVVQPATVIGLGCDWSGELAVIDAGPP
jgi:hypothetical protein